jgi:hypothetical protein
MRTEHFHMRCEPDFKLQIEDLRRATKGLPSGSEVLHRLVEEAWEALPPTAQSEAE